MEKSHTVSELKAAIKKSTKVYAWVVFAQTTDSNTQIGGFVETRKSYLAELMKVYALSSSKYDTTVRCFFREDAETGNLYLEGFRC